MEDLWCIEIYVHHRRFWMFWYPFKKIRGPHGAYFRLTGSEKQIRKISKKAEKKQLRIKTYEKRWARSSDYRRKFFAYYSPPYRCRYCHKRLKKENVEVDHIIPVSQTKNGEHHLLLKILRVNNVNDVRNLAASCSKCNSKKGSYLGIWFLKAVLGKYRLYWLIRFFIKLCIVIALFYLLQFIGLVNWKDLFENIFLCYRK